MKKFKTQRNGQRVYSEITEIAIDRETDSSVWIKGVRRAKKTEFDRYHDSWEQAYAYLLDCAQKQEQLAILHLKYAKAALDDVIKLKPVN